LPYGLKPIVPSGLNFGTVGGVSKADNTFKDSYIICFIIQVGNIF